MIVIIESVLILCKGLGVYGRGYVPWEAELMQPVRSSGADFSEEGADGKRVTVRLAASFTTGAEIARGEELILIHPRRVQGAEANIRRNGGLTAISEWRRPLRIDVWNRIWTAMIEMFDDSL